MAYAGDASPVGFSLEQIREAFLLLTESETDAVPIGKIAASLASIGLEDTTVESIVEALSSELKDGCLTLDGFLASVTKQIDQLRSEKGQENAFATFVSDGADVITIDDLRRVAVAVGPEEPSDAMLEAILQAADVDGDGKVTLADWKNVMSQVV